MSQMHRIGKKKTTVRTENGKTTVTLYSTAVLIHDPAAKTATLNSGGYETNTTKTRINQASNQFGLGIGVFQRKFDWFVSLIDGREVPFHDGMTVATR